jgi:hypothetical protein
MRYQQYLLAAAAAAAAGHGVSGGAAGSGDVTLQLGRMHLQDL